MGDFSIEGSSSSNSTGGGGAFVGDGFGVDKGGTSVWAPRGWTWIDSGSSSDSGSCSDSGKGAEEGDFCLTGGLEGTVRKLGFPEVEARVFDLDEAASTADISTTESSSDSTTGLLPLRTGCFLGLSDGTTPLDGSGLGGTEDLVDLRVGAGATSTSPCSSLTATDVLALPVLVEALEVAADRPFRGRGSCCMVLSLATADPSLVVPRLRLTGGGESSMGCPSSSISGTP